MAVRAVTAERLRTQGGRHVLSPLLASCAQLRLGAGDVRAADDLPVAGLIAVERGAVAVLGDSCSGRRVVLVVAVPSDLLGSPRGEQQLLALQEATLRVVTAENLRRLLCEPAAAEALFVALVRALHERDESLSQFANVTHIERVRRKLLQLARVTGTQVDGGIQIELPLTHALLAQMVGSARETVSTAVRALELEGFVTRSGGRYQVQRSATRQP